MTSDDCLFNLIYPSIVFRKVREIHTGWHTASYTQVKWKWWAETEMMRKRAEESSSPRKTLGPLEWPPKSQGGNDVFCRISWTPSSSRSRRGFHLAKASNFSSCLSFRLMRLDLISFCLLFIGMIRTKRPSMRDYVGGLFSADRCRTDKLTLYNNESWRHLNYSY